MTIKLYDTDSYLTEFEAKVLSCKECEKGFEVILDQTAFFPEEGGQCCDKGCIDGIEVIDVQLSDDSIVHYLKEALEAGKTVKGKIDFKVRFRNMQNHTGEHIICGIAHEKYGYENAGFHLGEDTVTMDLDGPLTKEQIDEIEFLANEAVYKNLEVSACYPPEEELEKIPYRSKSEIQGKVRIVTIDGVDICACCAPHVSRTGEVGIIKIVDFFAHRGGVRITLLCGFDALCDYRQRYAQTLAISNMLSVKQHETADGVKKLLDDMGKLRGEISEKSKALAALYADSIDETKENVILFTTLNRDEMRDIVNRGMKKCKGIVAVLSGNDTDGYGYIFGSENVKLKDFSKELNSALNGRGGGSDTMIQGNLGAKKEEIESFMKNNNLNF